METLDLIKKSVRWISEPIYFFITILSLTFFLISSLILSIPGEEIDIDNARYLLSAIIQSLAAILAIVVTVTLVAMQLASQTYTPRVLKDFMKNYLFWALISMYSIAIIGSLFFLNYIGTSKHPVYRTSFGTMFPILLTTLCLLYLVIYIRVMADQLSLKTILSNSLAEVTKKFIDSLKEKQMEIRKLDGIYTLEIPDEEEDRLTPVTEIITKLSCIS